MFDHFVGLTPKGLKIFQNLVKIVKNLVEHPFQKNFFFMSDLALTSVFFILGLFGIYNQNRVTYKIRKL